MVKSYHALRGVEQSDVQHTTVPASMLPERGQPILGCGLGELLHALRAAGWDQTG